MTRPAAATAACARTSATGCCSAHCGPAPTAGRAAATPLAACWTPGATAPRDCTGWFTTNVTVTWTFDPVGVTATDCNVVTIAADTAGSAVTCRVWYGSDYVEAGKVIRRDATPPTITGGATARPPDSGDWFNAPVAVGFAGTDGTSELAGCSGATYAGPDSSSAVVGGTCRDVAGNASSGSVTIRYDATPPAVAAAASRAPDENGWYRAPVVVSFTGVDGLSGVAACDAPVTYRGPDTAAAAVTGTCRDAAGNTGVPASLAIRYDATPPAAAAAVEVDPGDGVTRLTWSPAPAATRYELVRTPGVAGAKRSTLYRGPARSFTDRRVRNGVRYRYELLSVDRAGNTARRVVAALPRPPVFAPAAGAVLRRPPLAAWTEVEGARFYNAQLYRGTVKVLSAWVVEPRLRLPGRWTFAGRARTLGAGRYRLYVWPAFGTRARPRYGKLLGETSFALRPPRGALARREA